MPEKRPVYILGAGFSKAISSEMPVSAELTKKIQEKIPDSPITLREDQTFENWLTNLVMDVPFLKEWEKASRRALSLRILELVGEAIAETESHVVTEPIPEWLPKLLRKWSEEKARIITFNYDTLIESSINQIKYRVSNKDGDSFGLTGDLATYPAPPQSGTEIVILDGTMSLGYEQFRKSTLQIIKLHGSLNWFVSGSDSVGATLVRTPVESGFENSDVEIEDSINLDRYVIPPVLNKDSFYSTYLSQMLWRSAREAIENASELTFIGYSLPLEDMVTAELISQVNPEVPVTLVDCKISDEWGIQKSLKALGIQNIAHRYGGDQCVADYVTQNYESQLKIDQPQK